MGRSHLRRNSGVLLSTFSNLWGDFERESGGGVANTFSEGGGGSAGSLVETYRKEVKTVF